MDSRIRCVVLGGGGHARMVLEALEAMGGVEVLGVLDPDRSLWGKRIGNVPVLGSDDGLADLAAQGVTSFVIGLGGTGDNRPRRKLFERACQTRLKPLTVQHPSAVVSASATVGDGSVLGPLAVVNAGGSLGINVIVNSAAVVEHDCRVADHAHIAVGARLCGSVAVGEGAHVGAGATVREGISIGAGAIVGAGAVVVRDVEPQAVVVGVPARVMERWSRT